MTEAPPSPPPSPSTRSAIHLLLLLAAVLQLCRIVQVQSATGEVPFQSANDRSRWCTIASLAINGSYEIDDVIQLRDPRTRRQTWYTIDMVQHRGADGQQHFYSSKPPLLPTLYAGVYMAVRGLTGASLLNDPFLTARIMLVLVNWIPLLAFWWFLARWISGEPLSDWARLVLVAFAVFGTFLSTFSNTLNNHLPAALAVGVSVGCLDRILVKGDRHWRWFALAGLGTSFGAANELPALSWLAAAGAMLVIVDWKKALLAYTPALLPVAVAFFATNYMAHGELTPAYGHRDVGDKLLELRIPEDASPSELDPRRVAEALRSSGLEVSDEVEIRAARRPGVFELWDEAAQQRFALKQLDDRSDHCGVYQWGDWYDYPGSYWTQDRKQGVDRGEPDRGRYIFHCLIGHHGIFSLTPFWLVAVLGIGVVWRSSPSLNIFREYRLLLASAIVVTSLTAIAFYLARPLEDRNYGGVASGFRWSFWLTVPWIWLAARGLRWEGSAPMRGAVVALLAASVFSAIYPWLNPWTSPWLMQYGQYLGWWN